LGPFSLEYPDATLSILVGFVLLLLLLWKVNVQYLSYPYWRDLLNARQARIADNKAVVERELADARHLRDDYAARLQRIEVEARERIDAAVRDADAARVEIIAEAEQAATLLRRRSEEEIARERTRQRIQMRRRIVQIALDAAQQAVQAHNTETVQHTLIDAFIARVATDGRAAARATQTQEGA
jgi:F-type H+-transporting ATPase subunit b